MHLRLKFSFVATMVAAMGLLLVPGAFAQDYPPTGDDFITCTPNPAAPGDDVTCEAGVFQSGSEVDVLVEASVLLDTTVTADEDGVASFAFAIPEDHPQGTYEVTLRGTGPDGEPKVLAEVNPIAAEPASGAQDPGRGQGRETAGIAATGSDTTTYALGALVLLGIGGGAVYATRKKSKASA